MCPGDSDEWNSLGHQGSTAEMQSGNAIAMVFETEDKKASRGRTPSRARSQLRLRILENR
eukprot:3061601-Karenia_brevis.AAC.1